MAYDSSHSGSTIDAAVSAVSDLFEFPSKTQAQIDALSPTVSDRWILYNSTTGLYQRWNGSSWENYASINQSTGGNARGTDAIDLQYSRSNSSEVASGNRSVILGGTGNTSSGTSSVVSGTNSVSSGEASSSFGLSVVASGTGATAHGQTSTASGDFSSAGGRDSVARLNGQLARAQRGFANVAGTAQSSWLTAWTTTTNAVATSLLLGGTIDQEPITFEDDRLYYVRCYVVAKNTTADENAAYKIEGAFKRGTGVGSVITLNNPTATVIHEDVADWNVTLSADLTNGGMQLRATGEAGKTIRWVATIEWVEVAI